MKITWTMIPESEGSRDYGDTYRAEADGKVVAEIRDGGWTTDLRFKGPLHDKEDIHKIDGVLIRHMPIGNIKAEAEKRIREWLSI